MEITLKLESGEIEQLTSTASALVAAVLNTRLEETKLGLGSLEKIFNKAAEIAGQVVAVEAARANAAPAEKLLELAEELNGDGEARSITVGSGDSKIHISRDSAPIVERRVEMSDLPDDVQAFFANRNRKSARANGD